MSDHLKLGNTGENWAADWLTAQGYQVVTRNYRYGRAEIDIIARQDRLLVFVEVKTRKSMAYGEPEMAVDRNKIELIRRAAEQYIYETDWPHDIRFDVIAIAVGREREIRHVADAF